MIWDKYGYLTGVPWQATQARRIQYPSHPLRTRCRKPSKPVSSKSAPYVSIISAEVYRKWPHYCPRCPALARPRRRPPHVCRMPASDGRELDSTTV